MVYPPKGSRPGDPPPHGEAADVDHKPFFMFLGDLQNQAKIDFLKKQLFLAILRISAILELDFNEFSLYFRSQLGIFFDFLSGSYFEVNF